MSNNDWAEFEKEGEELYEYLTTHFECLFEPTGAIKYFDIRYTYYLTYGYYEGVKKECGKQVHKAIIPWIHEERRTGRLFDKNNWKPFRDQDILTSMYYGYRPLFVFHEFFYFQLIIERIYRDTANCKVKPYIAFQVGLYGWKEKGMKYVQPYNEVMVEDDRMMPDRYWKQK
jgi:hypothetical protein